MFLKLPWARKWMFWTFEKSTLQFLKNFWVAKLKTFSGKVKQSVKIYLNENFVLRTFLENGFGATLSSKTNVVSVWKKHLSVFWKFLSDVVETIFRESEAKRWKLFPSNFGHRKLLRKCFWSYIEPKNKCSEHLKTAFFSLRQVFEWRSRYHFQGKWDKTLKSIWIKIWSKKAS